MFALTLAGKDESSKEHLMLRFFNIMNCENALVYVIYEPIGTKNIVKNEKEQLVASNLLIQKIQQIPINYQIKVSSIVTMYHIFY